MIELLGLRAVRSLKQIQVPPLWRLGLSGERVTVGVVGTGVDLSHPDFVDNAIDGFSLVGLDLADGVGHETGIIWLITRIAPRAVVVVAKDRDGSYGYMQTIIDACERLRQLGIQILNLSIATDFPTDGTDPISREVNYLVENGVVVVAAAGNQGPKWQTIGAPGTAELSITVGKVSERDVVCWDSSRGPTLDGRLKPDCVAPGSAITAAVPVPLRKGLYAQFDCTSYAVPHVTGVVALLKQAYPETSPDDLKRALMEVCDPAKAPLLARIRSHTDPRWSAGAGRVNAFRSYEWLKNERRKQGQDPS